MDILSNPKKALLLGNEAVSRGALDAGIQVATCYPGTPASEIGDSLHKVAKKAGINFEYSTNEKVAIESAGGAALAGVRALVSMKNFGLNVASDSLYPLVYLRTAGLVLAFADDVGCSSSAQSEQDSRYMSWIGSLPMLEPSTAQEAYDFTRLAFDLSEKYRLPVLVRLTTRVSHTRAEVKFRDAIKRQTKGKFKKDPVRFDTLPPHILEIHKEIVAELENIKKYSESSKLNKIEGDSKIGIVTAGYSYNYVEEYKPEGIAVLKLGITNPLPEEKIKKFLSKLDKVLVLEELQPYLEKEVERLSSNLEIHGKDWLPVAGEFAPEHVEYAMKKLVGIAMQRPSFPKINAPSRWPNLCPGCPHTSTFKAVKQVYGEKTIYGGDIGCYFLGRFPPHNAIDFILCMGGGLGLTSGIAKVSDQDIVSFIGDATFVHAGLPALINIAKNNTNMLVVIMDNRITAMTGWQPTPDVDFEKLVKACGIKNVEVADPYNQKEIISTIKKLKKIKGPKVLISRRICAVLAARLKNA